MTVKDILKIYDNWNSDIVINDNSLNRILHCKTYEFAFKDGKYYSKDLMDLIVVSFGFYDGEICLRVNT